MLLLVHAQINLEFIRMPPVASILLQLRQLWYIEFAELLENTSVKNANPCHLINL